MKVLGTVKDAATEVPLPGATIRLYVREEELAVLQSDSEGKFRHESESQYLGEILICKVEKAGYEPQKVIQEFEEDEVTLAIKLVPGEEEKIEFTVNLKDEKRTPLKGVNISLEVNGEGVGVGISDKDGIFKIALSPDLEGRTINYDAELAGFGLASGAVLLKKETSHEITMKKITMKKPPAPPSDKKWLKIAVVVAGIAIVILAVMIIISYSSSSSIYVTSTPSGASVYLDGSYKGTTPKTITGVSAGSHTIKLSKSGYNDYTRTRSVKAGKRISINGKLISVGPKTGSIYVTSSPSAASVYLDDSSYKKGTTPKTITGVSAGSHTIKLSKSGYNDYTKKISVKAGKTISINGKLISVGPKTGSIYVTSTPSGASVYLDDSYKGTTPKKITGVSAGSHTIKLSKSGYKDYTITPSVIAGETKRINANLRQAPGSISVTPSPSGASISDTQWASDATASSEYSSTGWSAKQATGAPNTATCGDIRTAWAPKSSGSDPEWLKLTFDTPVHATKLRVHETHNAGFIYRVDLVDINGGTHTIWKGSDTTSCPGWFEITLSQTTYLVRGVILHTRINGWEEIDAVQLV